MDFTTWIPSVIGPLFVASTGADITGLWLKDQKYFAATLPALAKEAHLPVFDALQKWLDCYFAGKEPEFTLPLAPSGSAFRKAVWRELCAIPYGQTTTYGKLAQTLSLSTQKTAIAQAVGGAVGHNPISILIPCHRVVGHNGSLVGYAGGVCIKKRLLELEGAYKDTFFLPHCGSAL